MSDPFAPPAPVRPTPGGPARAKLAGRGGGGRAASGTAGPTDPFATSAAGGGGGRAASGAVGLSDPFAASAGGRGGRAASGTVGLKDPFATSGGGGRRGRGRAVIAWSLGLGLPLALALTMTALLSVPTDATPLSVDNPGPDGARAVAQVLARQGVTVVAAADTATAVAQASGDTTLVIAGPSPVSGRQLDWYAQADCDIVLIDPDPKLRDHLEAAIVENRLTVVEDPDVFANAGIVEGDNAATALRTLGAHRRLVWSVASWEEDDAGGAGGVWQLLPPWAGLVAVQLLIAAAGAAVWRGRRMGRLAPDELPVSVPASQITTGLGQLYRRGRALGHAGAALRGGTAARIGGGLGLGPATAPATLVARVARALGRAEPPIRELLYGPPPRSAAELTALARALDELEQEVAGR